MAHATRIMPLSRRHAARVAVALVMPGAMRRGRKLTAWCALRSSATISVVLTARFLGCRGNEELKLPL